MLFNNHSCVSQVLLKTHAFKFVHVSHLTCISIFVTCRPGDLEYATSNSIFLQPGSLNEFEAYSGQMYTEGMFIAQGAPGNELCANAGGSRKKRKATGTCFDL